MNQERLCSALESMLFAAEHPVGIERFKAVFGENAPADDDIKGALAALKERYAAPHFGIELREAQNGYHFVTKVENAEILRTFLQQKPFRLSRSALEVLAIIAYRQPITRAEVDAVRGIDSSHLMRVLIERDIVRMAGKAEIPGRPVQYATTPRFLEIVGLNSLNDLPPLSELEQLSGSVPEREDPLETGLDKFMEGTEAAERIDEENQAEYREIHALLETVQNADREVYESPLHAEIAGENRAALEAFQTSASKRSRKKAPVTEIRYEDLVVTDSTIEAAGVAVELPTEESAEEVTEAAEEVGVVDDEPPVPTENNV